MRTPTPFSHLTPYPPDRPARHRRIKSLIRQGFLIQRGFLLSVLLVAGSAFAEDSQRLYDSLFGEEAAKVSATSATKDKAEFAAKLLASAKQLKDDPDLQSLLLGKAYEFGMKDPTGYPTALQAVQQLGELVPAKKGECCQKAIDICRLQFKRSHGDERKGVGTTYVDTLLGGADDLAAQHDFAGAAKLYQEAFATATDIGATNASTIVAKLKVVQANQKTYAKIDELTNRLKTTPDDTTAAAELAMLYVTELDDLPKATAIASASQDSALQKLLVMAAKDPAILDEAEAKELGDWYAKLVPGSGPDAKPRLVARAGACYQRYLSIHTKEDGPRLQVKLALDRIGGTTRPVTVAPPAARLATTKLPEVISEAMVVGGPSVLVTADVEVRVTEHASLTIKPGTLLEFGPKGSLAVAGTFEAAGDEANPIIFTARDKKQGWVGIDLQRSNTSKQMSWCVVTLAQYGVKMCTDPTIEHCALVHNRVGIQIICSGGLHISDCIVSHCLEDGVVGGEDQRNPWTNVTISDCGGIGYHGTFKGWPIMKQCVITNNRNGGMKCEKGGGTYRGRPEVSNSNIFGNGGFDIFCNQTENYEFANVFIGAEAGKVLAKDPLAEVRNIIDGRKIEDKGAGVVVLKPVAVEPVGDCGVSRSVLDMAKPYGP